MLKLLDKIEAPFYALFAIDLMFWFSVITAMLVAVVYVLPTIVAFEGKHPRKRAICARSTSCSAGRC